MTTANVFHREIGEDTPLGRLFGFVDPPLGFYLFLLGAGAAYLLLVELVEQALSPAGQSV